MAFSWGTFYPNKWSKERVNSDLEIFYLDKIKDLDLREPEFIYSNDIIKNLHFILII